MENRNARECQTNNAIWNELGQAARKVSGRAECLFRGLWKELVNGVRTWVMYTKPTV
jgi:hypothetical protein